jgi:hypothetical protein
MASKHLRLPFAPSSNGPSAAKQQLLEGSKTARNPINLRVQTCWGAIRVVSFVEDSWFDFTTISAAMNHISTRCIARR